MTLGLMARYEIDERESEVSVNRFLYRADAGGFDCVRSRTRADGNAGANSRADRYVNPNSDSHA